MKEICGGSKDSLRDQEECLKAFHELFPDCQEEWNLLKIAYEKKVIDDFFAADGAPYWQKRVTIQKNLLMLLGIMTERSAATLLESLMFIFRWDFFVKFKRRWDNREEEQAHFHTSMGIGRTQKLPEISFTQKKKLARNQDMMMQVCRNMMQYRNIKKPKGKLWWKKNHRH